MPYTGDGFGCDQLRLDAGLRGLAIGAEPPNGLGPPRFDLTFTKKKHKKKTRKLIQFIKSSVPLVILVSTGKKVQTNKPRKISLTL